MIEHNSERSQIAITPIADQGVVGKLVKPSGEGNPRAVIALGGSEGGVPLWLARELGARGFMCLALAYLGVPPYPAYGQEIPIERIQVGVEWLIRRPEAAGSSVGLVGCSKGAEGALLAASLGQSRIGRVVAVDPAAAAFGGWGSDEAWQRSSWSWEGAPLPFVPYPENFGQMENWRRVYEAALTNELAVSAAAIAIERTKEPVLLVSGGRDPLWPAAEMAEMLVARAMSHGAGERVRHLSFPNAGHTLVADGVEGAPAFLQTVNAGLISAESTEQAWQAISRHLSSSI